MPNPKPRYPPAIPKDNLFDKLTGLNVDIMYVFDDAIHERLKQHRQSYPKNLEGQVKFDGW